MSSFRKRNIQRPIPGTRTSPQTGQVITSSGNPSLDVILGGGLPIGSICLIEEDKYVTHSKVLAKYFLAEGVISYQVIFLGSLDDDPNELLHKLPRPLSEDEIRSEAAIDKESGDDSESNKNGLRIAWRYNDLPMVNSEQSTTKIGHHFNLLEQMDPAIFDFITKRTWNDTTKQQSESMEHEDYNDEDNAMELHKNSTDADEKGDTNKLPTQIFQNKKYQSLLTDISELVRQDEFQSGINNHPKNICRVCITSLASPLWYDEDFPKDILKFLTVLRAIMRSALTVCFITMPMHLVAKCDETLVAKIRNLVDFSIELESFAGSDRETNPAFRDYSGILHMHKIAAINTLSAFMPETSDLAFKLRRKKFVIEKLHLPPELEETNNSADNQNEIIPKISCGSSNTGTKAPSMDF